MAFDFHRFEALKQRSSRLLGMRESVEQELTSTVAKKTALKTERALLDKVILVLKKLIETATKEDLTKIGEFATEGLKTVIPDQGIECIFSTLTQSGTPTLSIKGRQGKTEGPFLRTFGGGTWNVVSFVLRIIVILRLGMKKRLFLDEAFSKISSQYQPAMSALASSLCKKLDFKTLLVTHQPTFADEADCVYEAKLVKGALELERIDRGK